MGGDCFFLIFFRVIIIICSLMRIVYFRQLLFFCRQITPSLLLSLLYIFSPSLLQATVPLQVEVVGIEDPLWQNAMNFLDIEKKKDEEALSIRWIKRLHQEAPDQIRQALQPYGYYSPVIKDTLTEVDGNWVASYSIDKGPTVAIVTRDIQWQGEGARRDVFQEHLDRHLENASGTLVHSEYESTKSEFLNLALSAGYPKAKILKSEVLVDTEKNSAEITMLLDTGPRYYFGDISFKQDFLTTDLLEYYITIQPGELYSHEALLAFQQNLIGSNYAQEVTIKPLFNEVAENKVPLNVLMKPIPPHRFAFGFGYETDIGIRGSARWTDRLINRHGHHSDLYLQLAQKERELKGQYSIPVVNRLTDSWVSTVSYEYEENPTTISDTFELETAFARRDIEDTYLYKVFVLRSIENFTVDTEPAESTELLIFGGTVRFSDMEEEAYPQFGYYAFADLRGAEEALISDTSFTRLHLKGKYLLGLGESGRIDTRFELGGAWVDNFDVYPPSLRFFAGGDSSVRGYSYESLGPVNEEGVVVGGKNIVTGSFEYDHRLAKSWVVTSFVDAGNAYNDEIDKVYVGAGFGFRWLAPFGSLRVDFAWPVSEQPDAGDIRFHIGFGATL